MGVPAQVVSFRVREAAAVPLGVAEPGSRLVVDEVVVANSGGLPLPPGGAVRAYGFEGCAPAAGDHELPVPPLDVGAQVRDRPLGSTSPAPSLSPTRNVDVARLFVLFLFSLLASSAR